MKKSLSGSVACVIAACAALAFAASAGAALTVMSTGDGLGGCTLRATLEAAATNTTGGCGTLESPTTTINVPANTYTLSSQLEVKSPANVRITATGGGDAVISGGHANRVLEVASGATATLVGIEITEGRAHNAPVPVNVYSGYAGESGGGIYNKGTLTLEGCLVTENVAGNGADGLPSEPKTGGGTGTEGGSGGGIFNLGSLTILASTISKNLTGHGGAGGPGGEGEAPAIGHSPQGLPGGRGGPGGDGGGIYNAGSLYIAGSTISENATNRGGNGGSGGFGAGAQNMFGAGNGGDGGEGGNSSEQYQKNSGYYSDLEKGGGGILNAGSLTMVNSTVYKNNTGAGGNGGPSGSGGQQEEGNRFADSGRAGIGGGAGRGGGILSGGGSNTPMHLTNVTVYGNFTGEGGIGGGGGGGAANTLGGGAGGYGGDGGGLYVQGARSGSEAVLTQVTIAGNGVGEGGPGGSSPEPKFIGFHGVRGVGAGLAVGGRYDASGSGVFEANSIIAVNGNPALGDANCHQRYRPTYNDFYDLGNNVTFPGFVGDENSTCLGTVGDPGFGAFGDHGGPTQTILPSGVGVGIVPAAACTVHEDQRGEPRPAAGKTTCDAGAVETTLAGPGGGETPGGETPGGKTPAGGNGSPPSGGGPVIIGPAPPATAGGSAKASGGAPKVTGTTMSVPITCAGGVNCLVKAVLAVGAGGGKASGSSLAARAKGAKKLTVGVASATVAAGATKSVSVSLNGRGKGLLGKSHKLKTTLTVTLAGGSTPFLTRAVTFAGKG